MKPLLHRCRPPRLRGLGLAVALALMMPMAPVAHAGALTDGSVGAVQSLSGNFTIPQTLGTINGANLFHSFRNFSIATGESATFTTTNALQNVIARVTGGTLSTINGALRLDAASGSQPNFFLINPAGVIFGAGAAVDVPAGFHVSTANYLKFADGNFHADLNRGSTLSAAAPEAFGFLGGGTTPAAVWFHNRDEQGATGADLLHLTVTSGNVFRVAAGAVDVDSAVLAAPAGTVSLSATGTEAVEVPLSSSSVPTLAGTVTIANSGIRTVGDGGGRVEIRGGDITISNGAQVASENTGSTNASSNAVVVVDANNLVIENSANSFYPTQIASFAESSGNASDIEVNIRDRLVLRNAGKILSLPYPYVTGNGGNIRIQAGSMTIDGAGATEITGVYSDTSAVEFFGSIFWGFGNAGNVSVNVAGPLVILNEGLISSSTNLSFGSAGNIAISAGSLTVESTSRDQAPGNSGIFTEARGLPGLELFGFGKGGDISIRVPDGEIRVLGTGTISAASNNGNDAGNIDVVARRITLDARGGIFPGGIKSSMLGALGQSGAISIRSNGALEILNGATIGSSTSGSGDAGNITINAGQLKIDFSDTTGAYALPGLIATGVFTETSGAGRAGNIAIGVTGAAEITGGGRISSSTYAAGDAGAVTLAGRSVTLTGAPDQITGIEAIAGVDSGGQTGSIAVTASEALTIANDGHISIVNDATVADPGQRAQSSIAIDAGSILLSNASISASSTGNVAAGTIAIRYSERMTVDPSSITTSAVNGNGGSITIGGNGLLAIDHSRVTTSVTGTINGNGGDINISAPVLLLDTGFIQANTTAPAASGGDVNIQVDAVLSSANTLFVGGPPLSFDATRFGVNVIQAAAPDGVNGVIQIASPQVDLSGSLSGLSAQLMDFSGLAMDMCRIGTGSSLTPVGRGGLMPGAAGWIRP